jgi:excinuclease ABC subunit A
MSLEQAEIFFENIPSLAQKIRVLNEVGLGYISLGQAATTLSGGEAQRIKLAAELVKKGTGKTLYILDEPTTGLHFEDIRILLSVLQKLVDAGNTVIVIEHNLDVIRCADHIIDIGPEGGKDGGKIIAEGTPTEIAKNSKSVTGKYLQL